MNAIDFVFQGRFLRHIGLLLSRLSCLRSWPNTWICYVCLRRKDRFYCMWAFLWMLMRVLMATLRMTLLLLWMIMHTSVVNSEIKKPYSCFFHFCCISLLFLWLSKIGKSLVHCSAFCMISESLDSRRWYAFDVVLTAHTGLDDYIQPCFLILFISLTGKLFCFFCRYLHRLHHCLWMWSALWMHTSLAVLLW